MRASSRARSARRGARTGTRLVVSRDWDLFIDVDDVVSLKAFVFLMMIGGEGEVEARVSGGEWEMYPVCFGGLGRVLL